MSLSHDIRTGVLVRWAASVDLNTAIPSAKVFSGDVPAEPQEPYAQIIMEEGEHETHSLLTDNVHSHIIQGTLTIKVWSLSDTNLSAHVDLVQAAFGDRSSALDTMWTAGATTILHSIPGRADHFPDGIKQGQQVWRADVTFELLMQRAAP